MINFDVTVKDSAIPKTEALRRAYEKGTHRKIMAASGANVVKAHFLKLEKERHRGTSPFHFYRQAASSTKGEVRGRQAVVNIDHVGIGLRRFGGTVRPRIAKYLTIPVDPAAHGRRVREFGDSASWVINRRSGKGVVTLGSRVLYAVTTQAVHRPDPSVLPTDKDIREQVVDDLRVWTDMQGDRG
ncbi:hypothetical protein EGM51_10570 [Verrucomicrobia bacterium S94]|nr:hypothetical protein EGM51_10570 [Verrucomicrobia bacterium S94]